MRLLAELLEELPGELARQVFTHASWSERRGDSYARLAFLGDSVLALAVTAHLYPRLEAERFGAGRLTKIRAQAVSGVSCRAVAERLALPERLRAAAPVGVRENAAAFGGGVVSFASPCVLPIVPAYLSVITGLDVAEVRSGPQHHLGRIARDTTLFVAGFSAVFILLGLSATAVGQALFRNHLLLTRLSGVAVLTMALLLIGSLALGSGAGLPGRLRAPWMYAEARFHPSPSRFGPFAAPVAGAAFTS